MSYKVKFIPRFEKELKHLSKKYPSIKSDFGLLLQNLKEHPELGIPLGNQCYKIRMAITSKGKGKSGGAKIITCVKVNKDTVFLLTIFDKVNEKISLIKI